MPAKTILIIDDHDDSRAICRALLTHFGYVVLDAADPEEGIALALQRLPHLMLVDFWLPHTDARPAIERLRSEAVTRETPIILYTAAIADRELVESLPGIQRVLYKPVESARLLAAVRDLIGEAEAGVVGAG